MRQYYLNAEQASNATHETTTVHGGADLSLSSDISENTIGSDDRMKRYNFLNSKAPVQLVLDSLS